VVECFEAIDVGQQDRVVKTWIAPSLRMATLQTIEEKAAIGQFGQGVMERVMG
jgi:hypothetical protein